MEISHRSTWNPPATQRLLKALHYIPYNQEMIDQANIQLEQKKQSQPKLVDSIWSRLSLHYLPTVRNSLKVPIGQSSSEYRPLNSNTATYAPQPVHITVSD